MAALWLAGCANMQGIDTQAQLRDAPSLGLAAPSESLTPAPDWWAALGALCGALRVRTGSLWPGALVHVGVAIALVRFGA